MRDALSLLDQCAAFSSNIDSDTVSAAAGIDGREHLIEIINASAEKNPGNALAVADNLYSLSKDMQKLCVELTEQFRNLMLIKVHSSRQQVLCLYA